MVQSYLKKQIALNPAHCYLQVMQILPSVALIALVALPPLASATGCEADPVDPPCGNVPHIEPGADGGLVCGAPFSLDPSPSVKGRFAVKVVQYLHLNAAGIVETDAVGAAIGWAEFDMDPGALSGRMDLKMCNLDVPKIQIPGQPLPSTLELSPEALSRVPPPGAPYSLTGHTTCDRFVAEPTVVLAGARLATPLTDPLPWDPTTQTCASQEDTGCLFDLDEDGHPAATFIASNFPALDVDEVYASLRSWVALDGLIASPDLIIGQATFGLDVVVVGCSIHPLGGGSLRLCTEDEVDIMASITPRFTPTPGTDSTFVAVRVSPDTGCDEVIERADELFGR